MPESRDRLNIRGLHAGDRADVQEAEASAAHRAGGAAGEPAAGGPGRARRPPSPHARHTPQNPNNRTADLRLTTHQGVGGYWLLLLRNYSDVKNLITKYYLEPIFNYFDQNFFNVFFFFILLSPPA